MNELKTKFDKNSIKEQNLSNIITFTIENK